MSRLNAGYTAGGTIYPKRFVKLSTSNDQYVLQCGANEQIYGVSQPGTRDAPGVNGSGTDAASSGETLMIYEGGDHAEVECGGTVTRGSNVKSDTDGKAVAAATTGTTEQFIGGQALQSGVSGSTILVKLQPYSRYPALA